MKVLVTGANGFLGSHVVEELVREGHSVRALMRLASDRSFLEGVRVEEALGDVTLPETLGAAVEGVDAVVHTAGLVKARAEAEFDAVNAGGTANLLAALGGSGGTHRFVLVSSLAARGPTEEPAQPPLAYPPAPISAYGRSKAKAEEIVHTWARDGRPATILRPPVIYGPRDRALLPFFQLTRRRLVPLLGAGQNAISCVYVQDAARAAVTAVTAGEWSASATYTIDDGGVYTWREMLSAVEQAVGRKALRLRTPPWVFGTAALMSELYGALRRRAVSLNRDKVLEMRQRYWVCSHKEIERDLGWRPRVSLSEGAALTASWYREQGWL